MRKPVDGRSLWNWRNSWMTAGEADEGEERERRGHASPHLSGEQHTPSPASRCLRASDTDRSASSLNPPIDGNRRQAQATRGGR